MSGLIELTALGMSRPGPDATPEQEAAWYDAKGHTHEGLARQARTPAEQITELQYAAAAYARARRLLAGVTR